MVQSCVCVCVAAEVLDVCVPENAWNGSPIVHLVPWQLRNNHNPVISGCAFSNLLWQSKKKVSSLCFIVKCQCWTMLSFRSLHCILSDTNNRIPHQTQGSNIWFMSCLEWETLPVGEQSRWKQRKIQSVFRQNHHQNCLLVSSRDEQSWRLN